MSVWAGTTEIPSVRTTVGTTGMTSATSAAWYSWLLRVVPEMGGVGSPPQPLEPAITASATSQVRIEERSWDGARVVVSAVLAVPVA